MLLYIIPMVGDCLKVSGEKLRTKRNPTCDRSGSSNCLLLASDLTYKLPFILKLKSRPLSRARSATAPLTGEGSDLRLSFCYPIQSLMIPLAKGGNPPNEYASAGIYPRMEDFAEFLKYP